MSFDKSGPKARKEVSQNDGVRNNSRNPRCNLVRKRNKALIIKTGDKLSYNNVLHRLREKIKLEKMQWK